MRFTGKAGTCKTGDNLIDGVHCIVPTPLIGCDLPSTVCMVSLRVGGYCIYETNSLDVPVTCFDAPESRI